LIASGRDADIFEYGPGLVLRRSTTGRSQAHEARVMEHVASRGFRVPYVHELRASDTELVMDRIEGPSMLDAIARQPWTLWRHGATLARLHDQLHEIDAPKWLTAFPTAPGDRVGHFDLHPINVLLAPDGPVVIDWTNAAATRPMTDVAMTWLLLAAGQVSESGVRALMVRVARQRFVNAFLAPFDRNEVARELDAAFEWKARDPHMAPSEIATMRALAARAAHA
jgi:aminoglycoside phosphotransferase (APT) family kinase protein